MQKDIKIYTSPNCSYCDRAKELFAERGLKFSEIDITKNISEAGKIFQKYGKLSVPVIFIGEEVFFGYQRKRILDALK